MNKPWDTHKPVDKYYTPDIDSRKRSKVEKASIFFFNRVQSNACLKHTPSTVFCVCNHIFDRGARTIERLIESSLDLIHFSQPKVLPSCMKTSASRPRQLHSTFNIKEECAIRLKLNDIKRRQGLSVRPASDGRRK